MKTTLKSFVVGALLLVVLGVWGCTVHPGYYDRYDRGYHGYYEYRYPGPYGPYRGSYPQHYYYYRR
jgi:hypothetical protein